MVDIAIPISHENLAQPVDPQLFFQVNNSSRTSFLSSTLVLVPQPERLQLIFCFFFGFV
jgi:hypothetical protein